MAKSITLYPNIHLEYKNHNCLVNFYYPKLNISPKRYEKLHIDYFTPKEINDRHDLYNLLNFLNRISGTQRAYIATTKQIIFFTILLFISLCLTIFLPPAGICLILLSILGLTGYFNLLPKIKITANKLPKEEIQKINNLISFTYAPHSYGSERVVEKRFEKLEFDENAAALIADYYLEPLTTTSYEHTTKSGAADKRYKNNSTTSSIHGYCLHLLNPPKFYHTWYMNTNLENFENNFNKTINEINISIKNFRLGYKIEEPLNNEIYDDANFVVEKNKKNDQSSFWETFDIRTPFDTIKQNDNTNSPKRGGSFGKVMVFLFIISCIYTGIKTYKINYTVNENGGYITTLQELNEYAKIEKAPMGKEIGKIANDTVLKIQNIENKKNLTWIMVYKLTKDDIPVKTYILLPEKTEIKNENKYVLFNDKSRTWNNYYERVDKKNKVLYEKYQEEFKEAIKGIEISKGSDNIVKESVKETSWFLDSAGYFGFYISEGKDFYYLNKNDKSKFLEIYNKINKKYENEKTPYFQKKKILK